MKKIVREAEQQILRLRNHPCIALWCGCNERATAFSLRQNRTGLITEQYLLRGLVGDLTDSAYIPCSPYSYTDVDNDLSSGDAHQSGYGKIFDCGEAEHYRKYIAENGISSFSSECALMGPGRMRSTKKYISEKKRWPINDCYRFHFVGNPCGGNMQSFAECMEKAAALLFGEIKDAADYMKKGMLVHAEFMRSEYDFLRMSGNKNKGFLNWMWNDIWPTGTCSVIDWYFEKKPAYYAMKRIFRPYYTSFAQDDEGCVYAFCCNDTDKKSTGKLTVGQKTLDGEAISSVETEIETDADSSSRVKVEFDASLKNTYLYSEWKHEGKTESSVYFFDLWKDKKFTTDLTLNLTGKKGDYRLSVTANRFARAVNIIFAEKLDCEPEDNYFDLQKGESRSVRLVTDKELTPGDVKVLTYADEWDD